MMVMINGDERFRVTGFHHQSLITRSHHQYLITISC